MKLKTWMTTIAAGLALTACSNSPHKVAVKRVIPNSNNPAKTQNKAIDDLVNSNKVCLPLFQLVQKLMNESSNIAFTAYIQTRNLTDAGNYLDDVRLNQGLLLAPLATLTDTRIGAELTSSPLIGSLLNATSQSNCDQVSFPTGNGVVTFTVQKSINPAAKRGRAQLNGKSTLAAPTPSQGAPGRLTLVRDDLHETREYRVIGDDLVIDVLQTAGGVKACDERTPNIDVQTRYVLNLSGKDGGFNIGPRFAKLLSENLTRVSPEIKNAVTKTDAANKNPQQALKARGVGMGVKVSNGTLAAMSLEIQNKRFQEVQCKK